MIDDELLADKALSCYKVLMTTLQGGIKFVIATLDEDDDLQLHVVTCTDKKEIQDLLKFLDPNDPYHQTKGHSSKE